jgi:lipopolysaccharide transport system ATP-binding protein
MSRPAVIAENLGKLYRLGRAARPSNFREAISGAVGSTLRKLQGYGEDRARHEEFWALKDISFEIPQGEAVGILGRNGAGKSTLLKVLSRITEPTEGMARLRGRVGSLLEVGTGFHPELTGRENIFLNGSILGMKRAEIVRRFDEIVAFSEVERFLDTPVKRYSSGMYIRLAFAVAAHLEPEILVVDEVLAVGDLEFQKKCLGKMNEVVGHGRTVFFVSHNTQSIAALTSRCLVFKEGHLVLDAPTDQAIKYYLEMSLKGSTLGQPFIHPGGDPDSNYIAEARVLTTEQYGHQVWGGPIAFDFVIHVGSPMAKLCFMFWIANTQGAHITHFWQFDEGQPYQTKSGDYRLRCEIPKLRLYKGSYSVTAWISDTRGLLPIDARTQICQFEVDMGEFRRKGFEWRDEHATYLEEASWQPVVEL